MSESKPKKIGILEKIKTNKKASYLVIGVLMVLIAVITFSGVFTEKTSNKSSSENAVIQYVNNLESRLKVLLGKVSGVGKVSVAVNVESGMETVLASKKTVTETPNGSETVETPIVINGKTVTVKELYPKITGVLIVAEGADSIAVRNKIQQATLSLIDINVNKIEILTMK